MTESKKSKMRKSILYIIFIMLILIYSVRVVSMLRNDGCLEANSDLTDICSKMKIMSEIKCENDILSGVIIITNTNYRFKNISSGKYPVCIGISIVDKAGNYVEKDFAHIPIKKEGILKENEKISIPVSVGIEQKYINENYGIKVSLVQEQIAWIDNFEHYFWFK